MLNGALESQARLGPPLLFGGALGLFVCSRMLSVLLAPRDGDLMRRAWAHFLPISLCSLVATFLGQTDIAVGLIFGTTVGALTTVVGFIAVGEPIGAAPHHRSRAWAFVLMAPLILFIAGFKGYFDWRTGVALLIQGAVIRMVWREPVLKDATGAVEARSLPDPPDEPAGYASVLDPRSASDPAFISTAAPVPGNGIRLTPQSPYSASSSTGTTPPTSAEPKLEPTVLPGSPATEDPAGFAAASTAAPKPPFSVTPSQATVLNSAGSAADRRNAGPGVAGGSRRGCDATSVPRETDSPRLLGLELLLLAAAIFLGAWAISRGAPHAAHLFNNTSRLGKGFQVSPAGLAASIVSLALVMPMAYGAWRRSAGGHAWEPLTTQIAIAALNLCLLLPILILLPYLAARVPLLIEWTGTALAWGPAMPRPLLFPASFWRIDNTILVVVAVLLLPVASGKWHLGREEGLALIAGYFFYLTASLASF